MEAPSGCDWWRRGQLGGVWNHELLSLPAAVPVCLDLDTPGLGSRSKKSEQQHSPLTPPPTWLATVPLPVLSLRAGPRGSQGLIDSLASLIQFSSPTRHHLGLQEEEVGSASQIGLDVTRVIQLWP